MNKLFTLCLLASSTALVPMFQRTAQQFQQKITTSIVRDTFLRELNNPNASTISLTTHTLRCPKIVNALAQASQNKKLLRIIIPESDAVHDESQCAENYLRDKYGVIMQRPFTLLVRPSSACTLWIATHNDENRIWRSNANLDDTLDHPDADIEQVTDPKEIKDLTKRFNAIWYHAYKCA